MTQALALIVWLVIIIVITIFIHFCGYSWWASFVIGVLIGLIVLLCIYPFNFENRYGDLDRDDIECIDTCSNILLYVVIFSILILIAFIITSLPYYSECPTVCDI